MTSVTNAQKKIAVKDFGAKALLAADKAVLHMVLGVVGGIATGIVKAEDATGGQLEGLRGSFRFQPKDKALPIITAPVLWLPAGADATVKAALTAKEAAKEVRFLFELTVNRHEGGLGYSWAVNTLLDVVPDAVADPVAALFDEHLPVEAEAPAAPAPAAEAPAKTPAKAK